MRLSIKFTLKSFCALSMPLKLEHWTRVKSWIVLDYPLHSENYISISFHIEWDMIVGTVFLSILNQMAFHLVQNRQKNCHHDYFPINVKGNGNIVFWVFVFKLYQCLFYSAYVDSWRAIKCIDVAESKRIRTQVRPVSENLWVKQCSCLQIKMFFFNLSYEW